MRVFASISIYIVLWLATQALCEEAIPTYVDLEVGHSVNLMTKDGVDHKVTLISQSLNAIVVEVDGIQSAFDLNENDCGSPEKTLFREISGVLVLPEVMSAIQQSTDCREMEAYRRWHKLKVGWETGDQAADDDIEDPGFARIALMDPTDTLPQGIFPIEMSDPCDFLSNVKHHNYYLSQEWYGLHAGIDFVLPIGYNIVASRGGVITEIRRMCASGIPCDRCPESPSNPPQPGNYNGNLVEIEDDSLKYRYLHLDKVSDSISVGQKIDAGTYLGTLGCTGTVGSHLHFTMRLISGIAPHYYYFDINTYPFLYSYACTSPPVCNEADLDSDGDVDGVDLAAQSNGGTDVSLADFAENYGRNDCPK